MAAVRSLILILITLFVAYTLHGIFTDHPKPVVVDEYWGPASKSHLKDDEAIKPFKIDISQDVIKDLKNRLKDELGNKRLAPPLENVGFEYGFNTKYLKEVATYWLEKYDWKSRQEYMNRYPHFKTQIGGLDIHFQHVKPPKSNKYKKTMPIILIHGWPGSFIEMQRIIPYLLEPENSEINFEIIVPSLPGYGFSASSARPGLSPTKIAHLFSRLLTRLGFKEYYVLGEDWGALIGSDMALLDPKVKGAHIECFSLHPKDAFKALILSYVYPSLAHGNARTRERFLPWTNMMHFIIRESGYFHIQATKPDTIGAALSQSPSGLAAYILEKFSTWTNSKFMGDEDGGLLKAFTMDQMLDNVMIYWVTNSITSSMRLYKEGLTHWGTLRVPVYKPIGCSVGPEDVISTTEWTMGSKFPNLKQLTAMDKGGHFLAYERPQDVAKAALKFFNQLEQIEKTSK